MTSVSSTRAPQAPRPAQHEPQGRPAAAPDDLKALGEAFSKARDKLDKFAARQGKGLPTDAKRAEVASQQAAAPRARADDRETSRRPIAADRFADGQGTAAPTLAPPAPIALPAFPAAHVDPSGFAQMLADLWTRENGKGAKEVRVRFGENAWPTTGAHLVRNAAGALDIALNVDPTGAAADRQLAGLDRHLRDAGLSVGSLAIAGDETI